MTSRMRVADPDAGGARTTGFEGADGGGCSTVATGPGVPGGIALGLLGLVVAGRRWSRNP